MSESGSNPRQALVALQVLMQSIAQGDNQAVNRYLNLIQIDSLSAEKADSLLSRLITTSFEFSNGVAVKDIIAAFEPNFTDRYRLPIINRILMDLRFDDDVVSFVLRQFPEHSYQEIAGDFIRWDSDPNIMQGFVRLEANRGPLDVEEYRDLYNLSLNEETYNDIGRSFFAHQLDTNSGYATIPEWVHNYTGFEELPYEDEIVLPEVGPFIFETPPSTEEVVDILTEGLRASGRTPDEVELAQMELRKRLVAATQEEKAAMLQDALENKSKLDLADDEDIFAILGPANAIVDSDLADDDGLDRKYGGCRMLTCIEFEDFLDPSEEIVYDYSEYTPTDWFTGHCQVCHLKIRRPAHAIRMPLEHGGWRGCYCSEKCLRKGVPSDNILISALVDQVMSDLMRIGIQDRLPVSERQEEEVPGAQELELGRDKDFDANPEN